MTEANLTDTIVEAATEAAVNANASLLRALGVPANDAPFWHDEQEAIRFLKREVTKDVLGLPSKLTPQDNVNVGNIGLYVGVVRAFPACFGVGVLYELPKWVPASEPVTVDETTSEAQTGLTIDGAATELTQEYVDNAVDILNAAELSPDAANQNGTENAGEQSAGANGQ
jgi:hypothetical protein